VQEEIGSYVLNNKDFDTCLFKTCENYTLKLYGNKTPGSVSKNKWVLMTYDETELVYTALFQHPYTFPNFEIISTKPLVIYWDETIDWGTGVLKKHRCFLQDNKPKDNFSLKHFICYSGSPNLCDYFVKITLHNNQIKNYILTLNYVFELADSTNKLNYEKEIKYNLRTKKIIQSKLNISDSLFFSKTYSLPCEKESYKNLIDALTETNENPIK
jgi:hypothetical protein